MPTDKTTPRYKDPKEQTIKRWEAARRVTASPRFVNSFVSIINRNGDFVVSPKETDFPETLLEAVPRPFKEAMTIAVISFRMEVEKEFRNSVIPVYLTKARKTLKHALDLDLHRVKLLFAKGSGPSALKDRILDLLRTTSSFQPDLVCIHELGFPFQPGSRSADRFIKDALKCFTENKRPYIIAGSSHCRDTGSNIATLVSPQGEVSHYAKNVSAEVRGESIRVPPKRVLRVFNTTIGRFGIMLCLDAYDASQIFSAVVQNHSGTPTNQIPILVIPSYGMRNTPDFLEACKELSEVLANTVVVAHSDIDREDQAIFVCGTKLKDRKHVTTVSRHVKIFKLCPKEYLEARTKLLKGFDKEFLSVLEGKGSMRSLRRRRT